MKSPDPHQTFPEFAGAGAEHAAIPGETMTQLIRDLLSRIAFLEHEFHFSEADGRDNYDSDGWGDAKNRAWGEYWALIWVRDRLAPGTRPATQGKEGRCDI